MSILETAPERHLRAVLEALCKDDDLEEKITDMLEDLNNLEKSLPRTDASISETAGGKRKPEEQTLQICIYCDEAFCAATNAEDACISHESDGEMEVDEDSHFWADHDDDCHGEIDSDENRKEHPDGFVWTCCDKKGSQPGCREHPHKSRQEARVKT